MPKVDYSVLAHPKVRKHGKVDKSALVIAEPRRIRSPEHLKWIATQKCAVVGCQRRNISPHHILQGSNPKARGLKNSDSEVLPLCLHHHTGDDGIHRVADERRWCADHGIDAPAVAASLWERSPARKR